MSDNFYPADLDLYLPFLLESNFSHTWNPPDDVLDEVITSVFFNAVPPFAYDWIPPGNANYRGDGILAAIQPSSENGDTPEEMWKAKYEESIRNQIIEGVFSSIAQNDRQDEPARSKKKDPTSSFANNTVINDAMIPIVQHLMERSEEYWRTVLLSRVIRMVNMLVDKNVPAGNKRAVCAEKVCKVMSLFDRVTDRRLTVPTLMKIKYGDKRVSGERLRDALFELEAEDLARKESGLICTKKSFKEGSLLSYVDYHAWCVDENNNVCDYPDEDLITGSQALCEGAQIVRHPWEDHFVAKIQPQLEAHFTSFFENNQHLTRAKVFQFIDENAFPTKYCYVRAKILHDSNPSKYSIVIGSLGYRKVDGSTWWKYG